MTGRRILTLDVVAPCEWITANGRIHHMKRAKLTREWRSATRKALPEGVEPFTGPVHITAHIWKPRAGRWDPNNWCLTTKAMVDELVSLGLLDDDDHEHVIGPDHRRGGKGEPRIILTIEGAK